MQIQIKSPFSAYFSAGEVLNKLVWLFGNTPNFETSIHTPAEVRVIFKHLRRIHKNIIDAVVLGVQDVDSFHSGFKLSNTIAKPEHAETILQIREQIRLTCLGETGATLIKFWLKAISVHLDRALELHPKITHFVPARDTENAIFEFMSALVQAQILAVNAF